MASPKLKGMIFDLDGTLVDSKLDFVRMRADIGVPENVGILEHIERLSESAQKLAISVLREHEMAGARAANIIKGVPQLLEKITHHRVEKAVFTRNEREPTDFVIDRFFPGVFHSVVTRADAKPKPDPEGLLRICDSWHCSPNEVLFIGDYDYDLEAGKRAGIKTVLYLSDEPWPLYAEKAAHVTRDLQQFCDRFQDIVCSELGFALKT